MIDRVRGILLLAASPLRSDNIPQLLVSGKKIASSKLSLCHVFEEGRMSLIYLGVLYVCISFQKLYFSLHFRDLRASAVVKRPAFYQEMKHSTRKESCHEKRALYFVTLLGRS